MHSSSVTTTILPTLQLLAPEATPSLGDVTPAEPEYFITIEDGNFMDGCHVFFPSGWNQYVL